MMNTATLKRLSAALRVPAEWLTGELDSLPFVPKHGLLSGKAQVENEDLSAAKVRLSHLLTRTDKALRADLHAWLGDEAGTAYQSWGWAVVAAIAELASPVGWRLGGIVPKDGHPKVFVTRDVWGNSAAMPWLEQMLAPWFGGLAYLNAGALAELFRALLKNPQRKPYASGQMDAAILRALDQYEASRPQPEGKAAGAGAGSGRRRTGARTHR